MSIIYIIAAACSLLMLMVSTLTLFKIISQCLPKGSAKVSANNV